MRSLTEIQRDMTDYLPRYYGDIPVATNIVEREAVEAAQLNADAYDILAQMYVDTATWGLARWERIFGIVTDVTKPIDQRRSVIKSKLRGVGTVTTAMVKSVAEAYANGEVEVTESGTNLLPPFNSGWTLHENTRMRQANYAGKVSGSVIENPHIARANFNSISANNNTLRPPSELGEVGTGTYTLIRSLDGSVYPCSPALTSGYMAQVTFSFNLIEEVIRKWGVGVFGSATTTVERVVWLKANVTKLAVNWHGFGSGTAGNKAYFKVWDVLGVSWFGTISHSGGTVAKLFHTLTDVTRYIDANGFIHGLSHADASNGTIASTINTDFVELEIFMKEGSVPQPDYVLNMNGAAGVTYIRVPAAPNTTYTMSANGVGVRFNIDQETSNNTSVSTLPNSYLLSGYGKQTFTTVASTEQLIVTLYADTAGSFTISNPQLELGSVATPFENLPPYTVGIKFVSTLGIPANLADLETIIRETLPAHLAVNYVFTYKTFGEIAGYGATYGTIETAGLTFGTLETWEGS